MVRSFGLYLTIVLIDAAAMCNLARWISIIASISIKNSWISKWQIKIIILMIVTIAVESILTFFYCMDQDFEMSSIG